MQDDNYNKIALVGNPNCGKTTLFNLLTKTNQRVGNWPGVTVEKKIGKFIWQNKEYTIVDLPGIYSLCNQQQNTSLDQEITIKYLLENNYDFVINIVTATNLYRNLYLTLQLLEMGVPCLLVINMKDQALKQRLKINHKLLSEILKIPTVYIDCLHNKGVDSLYEEIGQFKSVKTYFKYDYNHDLENKIQKIKQCMQEFGNYGKHLQRAHWFSVQVLEKNSFIVNKLNSQVKKYAENIIHDDDDLNISEKRYHIAHEIVNQISKQNKQLQQKNFSEVLDTILLNKFFCLPIFLFVMYIIFELSMNLGNVFKPILDQGTQLFFIDLPLYWLKEWQLPSLIISLIVDGIGKGINTIANFVPQIFFMFFFLSLLEDCGYLARSAFIMDSIMRFTGLSGKSFLPLILGFGCNVPAVMATRTLANYKDRVLTCLMSPFMSCGARLAIFVVFASVFFNEYQGLAVFLLYLIGVITALITGFILQKLLFSKQHNFMVFELPDYQQPIIKNILHNTCQRVYSFIHRAGRIILPVVLFLSFMNAVKIDNYWERSNNLQSNHNSILEIIGHEVTPLFHPMGIDKNNWQATMGLFTGIFAKELVIGSLNTLYAGDHVSQQLSRPLIKNRLFNIMHEFYLSITNIFSMQMLNPFTANQAEANISSISLNKMKNAFTSITAAFCYCLFILLYFPCISTFAVIHREIGAKWAWFSVIWSMALAYSLAVIIYQISLLF